MCPYYRNKNIIKHTPTPHKIILPLLRERKTYLELKVQRFICKDCGKTWSADCSIAPRNSNISYELNYQILLKLKENFSRKDIVKLYGISNKTVERIMEKFKMKTM
ncbi:helix-turn-helix domain-containing protein [uncultured Granulicatella sp.]|uniref:helix-turn-helix domain-containing protein n=1 Tax=uncultured Granulicatella sp. TaxID=316089 RepID=UPI0028D69CD7|nr:helix-turn-helix domain-containing protein [uncultured Granulicatella sp.]